MTIMPEQLTDLDFPTPDPLIEILPQLPWRQRVFGF